MRRLLKASAVLTILAITFILLYGPIYRYVQSGPVGWELKKRVRDARATEVDMARIAAFPWDELFLFDPYSSPQSICKTLALQPGECATTIKNELEDEGEILMVFRSGGRVVHTDLHVRYHGDFSPAPERQPLSRAQAVFDVVADGQTTRGGVPWLKLVLRKPLSPPPDRPTSPAPPHKSSPVAAQ